MCPSVRPSLAIQYLLRRPLSTGNSQIRGHCRERGGSSQVRFPPGAKSFGVVDKNRANTRCASTCSSSTNSVWRVGKKKGRTPTSGLSPSFSFVSPDSGRPLRVLLRVLLRSRSGLCQGFLLDQRLRPPVGALDEGRVRSLSLAKGRQGQRRIYVYLFA